MHMALFKNCMGHAYMVPGVTHLQLIANAVSFPSLIHSLHYSDQIYTQSIKECMDTQC